MGAVPFPGMRAAERLPAAVGMRKSAPLMAGQTPARVGYGKAPACGAGAGGGFWGRLGAGSAPGPHLSSAVGFSSTDERGGPVISRLRFAVTPSLGLEQRREPMGCRAEQAPC